MGAAPEVSDRLVVTLDDLLEPFFQARKPKSEFRIGAEQEKIGLLYAARKDGASRTGEVSDVPRPIHYAASAGGEPSVVEVLEELAKNHGWHKDRSPGPLIALERDGASVTLEPGGQLELSGAPLKNIHEIQAEQLAHIAELHSISKGFAARGYELDWLGLGFHPSAQQKDLDWVPKTRYGVMQKYLPTKGQYGLDMMRRTATVQANFDYASEETAMQKLRVSLRLAPVFTAMFANSPFYEGAPFGGKSYRAKVWLDVDPERQGLVPAVLKKDSRFVDYVQWALDAPMFLVLRANPDGSTRSVPNTGQRFRDFLEDGFEGERAMMSDWLTHLNTMFPEVRLKKTLEVRGADSLPKHLVCAPAALWTGLLYDDAALGQADELSESFGFDELSELRPRVAEQGLKALFRGKELREVAAAMVTIAQGGLGRRAVKNAEGEDESVYLKPLVSLVEAGLSPSDELNPGSDRYRSAPVSRSDLRSVVL